jgi:hypothetical protein
MPIEHSPRTPVSGIYNGPNYEGVWNPITRALSSAELKTVRFRVATFGVTGNTQILPGLQWSDDGVNWTSAAGRLHGGQLAQRDRRVGLHGIPGVA